MECEIKPVAAGGWKPEIPTMPGTYLRIDPIHNTCIRQRIWVSDGAAVKAGKLCLHLFGAIMELSKFRTAGRMYWFGPLDESNDDNGIGDNE